jgi:hypothetical protein
MGKTARLWMKNGLICRYFPSSTWLSTAVEDAPSVACQENTGIPGAALSGNWRRSATVENMASERSVYTRRSRTLIEQIPT